MVNPGTKGEVFSMRVPFKLPILLASVPIGLASVEYQVSICRGDLSTSYFLVRRPKLKRLTRGKDMGYLAGA